ncbi:hypothetical protein H6F42_06365 [Pseudanabaena sp. FACHB-1998]|uniref:hypothetical protein n=1 Tax=Pseudanabaena sp. FACHB-1998 TaxID=2692858 RepID=UPI0016813E78|nr:hypothetical protein [Pseudanabaena sp. FACHB-1998]MBD2176537.1 hypothetical protein [Pseudanabaena sp. FACHB-1998]
MQKQRALSTVGLWWRWVLATLTGAVIGYIFGIPACLVGIHYLSDRLVSIGVCHTGFGSLNCPVATGIVCGSFFVSVFVGLMQYLVLRRFLQSSAWWILASSFGWTWVGFAATSLAYTPQFGFVMNLDGSFSESNIFDRLPLLLVNSFWLFLAGGLLGILQCLVLWNGKNTKLLNRRSLWWIVVNSVLIAFMAIAIVSFFRGKGSLYGILYFFLGFTPFYATITAATLAKMKLTPFPPKD